MNKLTTGRYVWRDGDFVRVEKKTRSAPQIMPDLPGYMSPLGDGYIEGRAARRESMKRNHVREVDPSERPEGAGISKTEAQAAAERAQLDARPAYAMPEHVRRRLLGG